MENSVLDLKATGARIKELRKANHLTVQEIADRLGLESVQSVYKWQRGDGMPSTDSLYALVGLFGTSDILRGSREKDENPSLPVYGAVFYTAQFAC